MHFNDFLVLVLVAIGCFFSCVSYSYLKSKLSKNKFIGYSVKDKLNVNILCISDTHGQHRSLNFQNNPATPVHLIVHAGDMSRFSDESDLRDFVDWLIELNQKNKCPHKHFLFINGNHEANQHSQKLIKQILMDKKIKLRQNLMSPIKAFNPSGSNNIYNHLDEKENSIYYELSEDNENIYSIHHLVNELIELPLKINGENKTIKVYGRDFYWPMKTDNPNDHQLLNTIKLSESHGVDILISHVPPKGLLDSNGGGCQTTLNLINQIKPRLFVCGHIHHEQGTIDMSNDKLNSVGPIIVNAASVRGDHSSKNKSAEYFIGKPPILVSI